MYTPGLSDNESGGPFILAVFCIMPIYLILLPAELK